MQMYNIKLQKNYKSLRHTADYIPLFWMNQL